MQGLPLEERGEEGGLSRKINVSLQYKSMRVSVMAMENPEDRVAHWKALVFLPQSFVAWDQLIGSGVLAGRWQGNCGSGWLNK